MDVPMTDRRTLFQTLCTQLGLPPEPQSLIGGAFLPGTGEAITLEDPYTRQTLAQYPD